MMVKPLHLLLAASLLAGACAPAPPETASPEIALELELLENDVDSGRFRAALTLVNRGGAELAGGWQLWFNFGRAIVPESLPAGVAVTHVNGDLVRLEPTADFEPLPPGGSRRIPFEGRGSVVRESDAPAGPYVVFSGSDGGPGTVETVSLAIAPFDPRQSRRTADDRVEVPTPASRYRANAGLTALDAGEVGPIVPTPVRLSRGGGTLTLSRLFGIRQGGGLEREASYLFEALEPLLGSPPPTVERASAAPDLIVLELGEVSVAGTRRRPGDEAYRLEIDPGAGVRVVGTDPAGVFYGISSLLALVPVDAWSREEPGPIELPEVAVEDAPRFAYRGMHLDVARNFQTKDAVLKLLDLIAFYKLNRFHLHLSDDEGWRLAIAGLPELTEVGGRRGHSRDERDWLLPSFGSGPDPDPAVSHGSGHYSREDFREILRHARDRHVRVIPEFDVPGHARAAIKAMAARHARLEAAGDAAAAEEFLLQDPGDTSEYRSVQGWSDNVVDVCLESTYRFLEAVVADVAAIYAEAGVPLEVFHVGGDEVPAGAWERSPACRRLIEESPELAGTRDLPPYFLGRVAEILDAHDLVTAGWEEIALEEMTWGERHVKAPSPAFVERGFRPYVWNSVWGWGSEDLGYRLANAGYKVVLSNASNLYFDLAYEKHPEEPGYDWAGYVDTRRPWELEPLDLFSSAREDRMGQPIDPAAYASSARLTAAGRRNVLGIQGQLWGENAKGPERLEYLAFPKLLGLAERAWAPRPAWAASKDPAERARLEAAAWNDFANRLGQRELLRLDHMLGGVGYRLPPPGAVIEDGKLHANVAFPGLAIRYAADGGEPTAASPRYAGPVAVTGTVRLKTFDTRGRGSRTSVVPAD